MKFKIFFLTGLMMTCLSTLANNTLVVTGDNSDFISDNGKYLVLTDLKVNVARYAGGAMDFSIMKYLDNDYSDFLKLNHTYSLTLYAPQGEKLKKGTYLNADNDRFKYELSNPGLSFNGGGRACQEKSGQFTIYDVDYDNKGKITKIAVDIEQQCYDMGIFHNDFKQPYTTTKAALRFNSDYPLVF